MNNNIYEQQIKSIQEIVDKSFELAGDDFAFQHLIRQNEVIFQHLIRPIQFKLCFFKLKLTNYLFP